MTYTQQMRDEDNQRLEESRSVYRAYERKAIWRTAVFQRRLCDVINEQKLAFSRSRIDYRIWLDSSWLYRKLNKRPEIINLWPKHPTEKLFNEYCDFAPEQLERAIEDRTYYPILALHFGCYLTCGTSL